MSFNFKEIRNEIDSIDKLIADYKTFEADAPSMASVETFVDNLKQTIRQQSLELDEAKLRANELKNANDEIQKDMNQKKEQIAGLETLVESFKKQIAELKAELELNRDRKANNGGDAAQEIQSLRNDLKTLLAEKAVLQEQLDLAEAAQKEIVEKLRFYNQHIDRLQTENRVGKLMMRDAEEERQKRARSPQSSEDSPRAPPSRRSSSENVFEDAQETPQVKPERIQKIEDIIGSEFTSDTKRKNLAKGRFTKAELSTVLLSRGIDITGLKTNAELIAELSEL